MTNGTQEQCCDYIPLRIFVGTKTQITSCLQQTVFWSSEQKDKIMNINLHSNMSVVYTWIRLQLNKYLEYLAAAVN